jgi:PAS domain S-box-containing protein
LLQAKKKIFLYKLSIKRHKEAIDLERRWKAALDSTNEGVWISYLDTKKVFYSNKWKEMLGYEPRELPDKLSTFYSLMHPDDVKKHKQKIEECKKGKSKTIENVVRLKAKDGTYKWIKVMGSVYAYNSKGKPIALIGTHTDLTELMEINEKLSQLNDFYEALLLSNRLLVKETDLKLLFHEICKIAVEYGKLMMARVDLVDEKNGFLKDVALYVKDDKCLSYIEELKQLLNDLEARKYSGAVQAIERKDIIIVNDFETDDSVNEIFKLATQKANIKSAVAFPIVYADRVYAVFTLYADKEGFFEGNILDLISYFANDLTYAIERNI